MLLVQAGLNIFFRVATAAQSFFFTPLFLKFLGADQYGIIAILLLINNLMLVFDFGIGSAIQRELAKGVLDFQKLYRITKQAQFIYLLIGCVLFLSLVGFSSQIFSSWFHSRSIAQSLQSFVPKIIALIVLVNWPSIFFTNCLIGLKKFHAANFISFSFSFMKNGGCLLYLSGGGGISSFLSVQWIASLCQSVFLAFYFWGTFRSLYPFVKEKMSLRNLFAFQEFREMWRFATGTFLLSLLSLFIIQIDKVIASTQLSLADFAKYSIIASGANSLYFLITPLFVISYPRLVSFISSGRERLAKAYHDACKLLAAFLLPAVFILIFYSDQILERWIGSSLDVSILHRPFIFLVIGTAANGLMNIPYALQLASGSTRISTFQNILSILILTPAIFFMIGPLGLEGPAMTWAVHNVGCLIFTAPLFHKKFLPGVTREWWIKSILQPLFLSLIVPCLSFLLPLGKLPLISFLFVLLLIYVVSLGLVVIFCGIGKDGLSFFVKEPALDSARD
jgi:O-antigen/teichoic acid export membrane protein